MVNAVVNNTTAITLGLSTLINRGFVNIRGMAGPFQGFTDTSQFIHVDAQSGNDSNRHGVNVVGVLTDRSSF